MSDLENHGEVTTVPNLAKRVSEFRAVLNVYKGWCRGAGGICPIQAEVIFALPASSLRARAVEKGPLAHVST